MTNFQDPWGVHCLIDAAYCDHEAINSHSTIRAFVDEVLTAIDMVKIGGLTLHWCDTTDPIKSGISGIQLLQDSHLSFHFCPEDRNSAYLDCFSCKDYNPDIVKSIFKKYFKAEKIHMSAISRRAPERAVAIL